MTKPELRIVAILASIFALRMFGLCLLLPIFAIEALKYTSATPQLIGLAIGIYGLAQAVLQIPFGMLSDKYGRKPLIWSGLGLIVLGSLIGSLTHSIYGLIIGRILQGCGAIGSVVLALLADHISPAARTIAMAILGVSIGASFALAFILGPWLNQLVGMSGIFLTIGALALIGSSLLSTIPNTAIYQAKVNQASFKQVAMSVLSNRQLVNLNIGVFVLHACLAAVFLVLPGILQAAEIAQATWWQLYLLALSVATLIVWRVIKLNTRRPNSANVLQNLAIIALLVAEACLCGSKQWWSIAATLVIFFTGFCWLEASLPTLVSKYAPAENRGAALGAYSCLQFFGMFIGGVVGGKLQSISGAGLVLGFCIALTSIWLLMNLKKQEVRSWQEV